MKPNFLNLPRERRDQILNGAMSVFGKNSYDKASTDEIARTAGISKGLLYHYFDSKKGLYLALYRHCVGLVLKAVDEGIDPNETDFFRLLELSLRSKLELLKRHPPLFAFLMRAYKEPPDDDAPEIQAVNAELAATGARSIFGNLDERKFRPGLDLPKVIDVMGWISDGFMKAHQDTKRETVDQITEAFNGYMAIFKRAFYKEEDQ